MSRPQGLTAISQVEHGRLPLIGQGALMAPPSPLIGCQICLLCSPTPCLWLVVMGGATWQAALAANQRWWVEAVAIFLANPSPHFPASAGCLNALRTAGSLWRIDIFFSVFFSLQILWALPDFMGKAGFHKSMKLQFQQFPTYPKVPKETFIMISSISDPG